MVLAVNARPAIAPAAAILADHPSAAAGLLWNVDNINVKHVHQAHFTHMTVHLSPTVVHCTVCLQGLVHP